MDRASSLKMTLQLNEKLWTQIDLLVLKGVEKILLSLMDKTSSFKVGLQSDRKF